MNVQRLDDLVAMLRDSRIDRREFFRRAAALGLSASAIGMALQAAPAFAQASSSGAPQTAADIGAPGITHITTTSKGTIHLYSSWPLSAASKQIGGDAVEAIKMAFEDRGNAAGGYALKYTALDDGIASKNGSWDAGKEAENANTVVNDKDCMTYMGTYNSGAAEISIPILNKADMAMISYANTAVELTKSSPTNEPGFPDKLYPTGKRNYMRVCPADDIQGAAAANWAYNTKKLRRAYVLNDNQIYGKGVATAFADNFKKLGGTVLANQPFDPNQPSYSGLMDLIASKNPDILYVGSIVNLNPAKVLQDMRNKMSADKVVFMGPDGLANQAFIDAAGDAAEGAYITFGGLPPEEMVAKGGAGKDYVDRITKRLGHTPDSYAVYSYEVAAVVVQAIDKAGVNDRAKILDAMFHTEGFRGLLGTWSFGPTGDTTSATISLNVVKNATLTFQQEIHPATT